MTDLPTTADYAMSEAGDARRNIERLATQVVALRDDVDQLTEIMARFEDRLAKLEWSKSEES